MKKKQINVLGHVYNVLIISENKVPNDLKFKHETANGLCENYSNELIIFNDNPKPKNYRRLDLLREKVSRHELLHAYFNKSGLTQLLSTDAEEAIVDMLAINYYQIAENVELLENFLNTAQPAEKE